MSRLVTKLSLAQFTVYILSDNFCWRVAESQCWHVPGEMDDKAITDDASALMILEIDERERIQDETFRS